MTATQTATLQEKLAIGTSQELPVLTRRQVPMTLLSGKAQAVIGMRRAGKTCFLFQQMQERLEKGIPRERMVYLNFEDERLPGLEADALTFLLDEYYRTHPGVRGRDKVMICLDDIQLVKGWESFVRRILDSEKLEVFLSGSSAKMLSQEVATSMRGRALEVIIHPFSFRELLAHESRHRRVLWANGSGGDVPTMEANWSPRSLPQKSIYIYIFLNFFYFSYI